MAAAATCVADELLQRTAKQKAAADAGGSTSAMDYFIAKKGFPSRAAAGGGDLCVQCEECGVWLPRARLLELHVLHHAMRIVDPGAAPGDAADPKALAPAKGFALFLGSENNSADWPALLRGGVKRVLNVAKEAKCYHPKALQYLHLPLEDVDTQDLAPYWEQALAFLDAAAAAGEPVLVHCVQGISRSASFVAASLMRARRLTLSAALSHVRARRSLVQPNRGFLLQLTALEVQLFGGQPTVKLAAWHAQPPVPAAAAAAAAAAPAPASAPAAAAAEPAPGPATAVAAAVAVATADAAQPAGPKS